MSFREISAWVMLNVLLIITGFYFFRIWQLSPPGELISPNFGSLLNFTITLIIWTVISHIVLSIIFPKDANAPRDERDRIIDDRAGHISGLILGIGAVTALGHFLFYEQANLLFYMVFAALVASQVGEYLCRIFYYRRGV